MTVSACQTLPLRDLNVEVLSSNGEVITKPVTGAGATNSFCDKSRDSPARHNREQSLRRRSSSFSGRFSATDLGDLTWDKERALMCPVNRIGTVSLLIVSHHGWYQSSSPAYVDAVHPEVAIMDNGL